LSIFVQYLRLREIPNSIPLSTVYLDAKIIRMFKVVSRIVLQKIMFQLYDEKLD